MASRHPLLGPSLTIACATCPVREHACADCMVTALLALEPPHRAGPEDLPLDRDEVRALEVLAHAGLVTPSEVATARARRRGPGQLTVG